MCMEREVSVPQSEALSQFYNRAAFGLQMSPNDGDAHCLMRKVSWIICRTITLSLTIIRV
jgi:hypothetical protein